MQTHSLQGDSPLQTLIGQAHRRALAHAVIAEFFTAAAVSLLGLALLLIAGTNYFPIPLLWLFCVFGLGAAIYRWIRSRATRYQVAQQLDSRWSTHDQISTAYHFLDHEAPAARAQRLLAEEAGRTQDIARALPFQLPASGSWLLAVALLTTSLWVLRYVLHPSLTLKPPLPALVTQALYGGQDEHTSPDATSPDEPPGSPQAQADGPLDRTTTDLQGDDLASLRNAGESDGMLDAGSQHPTPNTPPGRDPVPDNQDSPAEGIATTDSLSHYNTQKETQPDDRAALAASSSDGDLSRWNPPPSSLLERLQEMLQNMLAASERRTSDRGENPSGTSSMATLERHRRPGAAQDTPSGQDSPSSSGGDDQQASIDQVSITSTDGAADQTNTQAETQVATAGQGDGSKQSGPVADPAAQFTQLAELYQRRTEEIRGAFTIETSSSRQSARTSYLPKKASHHAASAVVNRDEIPMRYRAYIKEYFKHLR